MDDVVGEEDDQPSSLGKKHITKLYTFPRFFHIHLQQQQQQQQKQ